MNFKSFLEVIKQMPYADPEKNKECIQKYYQDNKQELNEKNKKYHEENREKMLENMKKYRESNKEQIKEYKKKFYQENKDKVKEKSKEYYEENKEGKIKEYMEVNKEKRYNYNKEYKKCRSCKLFASQTENNYLCSYCNPNKKTKRLKTKELKVKTFLEEQGYKFDYNKKCNVDKSCQTYFPDFMIDCNSFFLIIECDEDGHKSYDNICERIRENNICFALGLPCVFIRYNPDKKNIKMNTKEKVLKSYIEFYKSKENCDNETVYLFY